MEGKKVITVVGATGNQGGGLVRALLQDTNFTIRAITRDVNSQSATELKLMGVEVVRADLDDIRSLENAFTGADGAFLVTNYWESMNVKREQTQLQNLLDAIKSTGVGHVVYSSLDDTREFLKNNPDIPTLTGNMKVPHFDSKGAFNKKFINEVSATVLLTTFYYENFISFGMGPKMNKTTGKYQIALNMGKAVMPMIAVNDIGRAACEIFKNKDRFLGKTVGIAGSFLTLDDTAKVFSDVLEIDCEYNELTRDEYAGLGFPGAEDLANMFAFYASCEKEFVDSRRSNIIQFESFRDWVFSHKEWFAL